MVLDGRIPGRVGRQPERGGVEPGEHPVGRLPAGRVENDFEFLQKFHQPVRRQAVRDHGELRVGEEVAGFRVEGFVGLGGRLGGHGVLGGERGVGELRQSLVEAALHRDRLRQTRAAHEPLEAGEAHRVQLAQPAVAGRGQVGAGPVHVRERLAGVEEERRGHLGRCRLRDRDVNRQPQEQGLERNFLGRVRRGDEEDRPVRHDAGLH